MPQMFKALSSIASWVLFILGLTVMVVTVVNWLLGAVEVGGESSLLVVYAGLGLSAASLFLSAAAMKLRQTLV